MAELPALPPGFVLDEPDHPPLPPGFVLDAAPAPQQGAQSFLGKVGDWVAAAPARASSAVSRTVSGAKPSDLIEVPIAIAKGVAHAASDAAQLPGDVYAGREDPLSQKGLERTFDLAGFASPSSAGAAGRQVAAAPLSALERDAAASGVTLTAGQRTGKPSVLATEDAAFGGGLGAKAQDVAQAARARQMDELFRARDDVGDVAGRGAANLERPADAGGIVADAVKANAAAAKLNYQNKYGEAFSSTGSFKPDAFKGVSKTISESLANKADPVLIDDVLTPAANRALTELDNIQNLRLSTNGQPAAGDTVVGINLRGVDQARRRLAAYAKAGANDTDKRATSAIIKEFDEQIEQAVTKGLFDGDEAFLGALKDARGAFASYQKTFKQNGRLDDSGRVLETMVKQDVTPEQVANYIYGSSKVGANATSVRTVQRLKQLLGEESAEWSAIRQGAWQKLTGVAEGKTPMGGQKASERISEFLNGDGKTFAKQLFSEEERALMARHANLEKALASKAGTTNPPNSGNRIAALARDSFATIGGMLGMSTGGPQGAAAGYAAGKAAGGIGDMRNAAQARKLFRGEELVPISERLRGGADEIGSHLAVPTAVEVFTGKREIRNQR